MRIDKDGNTTVTLIVKVKVNAKDWSSNSAVDIREVPTDVQSYVQNNIFAPPLTLDSIPVEVEVKLNRN